MQWQDFPKDIQIYIAKQFDIDLRIKLGWIRKLQIPEHIKSTLSNICNKLKDNKNVELNLGFRKQLEVPGYYHPIYRMNYLKHKGKNCWWIVHYGKLEEKEFMIDYVLKNEKWIISYTYNISPNSIM